MGLDTPASVVAFLKELDKRGYGLVSEEEGPSVPENGDELMRILQEGITNDEEMNYGKDPDQSITSESLFGIISNLPESSRDIFTKQWIDNPDYQKSNSNVIPVAGK